jgi:hypothetical protein
MRELSSFLFAFCAWGFKGVSTGHLWKNLWIVGEEMGLEHVGGGILFSGMTIYLSRNFMEMRGLTR